jgi:digeranylgeranylglycerophospholipid reductase
MDRKVIVIGAGVIGLTLATELAKSGVDTTVYESKASVSQNAGRASGIFSREGLSRMGIDYSPALQNTLNGAIIHGGGELFSVETEGTKAFVLDRRILAELCAENARMKGARIVLNKRIGREELLDIARDKSNILVGADGAVSNVASAFGFPQINEYVLTYKAEYANANVHDLHRVELFFSNRVAKRFFGWSVPYSKSTLEVGVGISSHSGQNSTSAFNAFINNSRIGGMIGGAEKTAGYASIIPLQVRKRTVMGNVLLVGDAAGQVKATTGGGIIFGTACARLAAGAITEHISTGRKLARYENMWRRAYGLDLRLHKMVHGYYSNLGDSGLSLAIRAARLLGFEKFLSDYGDMDSPKLMFKRFFLRGLSN